MNASHGLRGVDWTRYIPLLVLALGLAQTANAAVQVTSLGPLTYRRNPGKPTVYHATFPGVAGIATLHVEDTKASMAFIRLNGRLVAPLRALKPQPSSFEVRVHVKEQNEMEVTLVGKPGSWVRLSVSQSVDAAGASIVGAGGGSLVVTDVASSIHGARLDVPPGALSVPVVISLNAADDAPPFADGSQGISAVRLGPPGLTFGIPAALTLPYRDEWLDFERSVGEETLKVYFFHDATGSWIALPSSEADVTGNFVTTRELSHFSLFSLRSDEITSGCTSKSLAQTKHLPVLLVHGLQPYPGWSVLGVGVLCGYGDAGTFGDLQNMLRDDPEIEADIFTYQYGTAVSIESSARSLAWAILKVQECYEEKPPGVVLIAHSMGGLVARAAINYLHDSVSPFRPDVPVFKLATLASPHRGSEWSDWIPGDLTWQCPSIDQMAPCSEFLEGQDGCNLPQGGLNGRARQAVVNLLAPGVDYHLFAGSRDPFVGVDSALGLGPGFNMWVFEPPGIPTVQRIKQELPGAGSTGCRADGSGSCTHNGLEDGIANVTTPQHALWPILRNMVLSGPWATCPLSLPTPAVEPLPGDRVFCGSEGCFHEWPFRISNWTAFPAGVLPNPIAPCTEAGRLWLESFSADTGARMYGYCGLNDLAGQNDPFKSYPFYTNASEGAEPSAFTVEVRDLKCGLTSPRSAAVPLP